MKELMITIARIAPGQEKVDRLTRCSRINSGPEYEYEFLMRDMFVDKTEGPIIQFRRSNSRREIKLRFIIFFFD